MHANFQMNADDLNDEFLASIKERFAHKHIEITISESVEAECDETEYLLSTAANRDRILRAIDNVAHMRNLVNVELESDS